MNKKRQIISGKKTQVVVIPKSPKYFSESEKRHVIEEYLHSDMSKQRIWEKYIGQPEEHGSLLRCIRQLGYIDFSTEKRVNIASNNSSIMNKKNKNRIQTFRRFHTTSIKKKDIRIGESVSLYRY